MGYIVFLLQVVHSGVLLRVLTGDSGCKSSRRFSLGLAT